MVVLKNYNDTYFSLTSVNDNIYRSGRKKGGDIVPNFSTPEEIERVSLSRTKRRIKEICLSNNFEYFITCTISSVNCDRFSLQVVQDKMKKSLKALKRKWKDLKFIYITEKHENGAFHFHGMMKGIDKKHLIQFTEKDKIPPKLMNLVKSGEKIYHVDYFDDNFGWNTFQPIKSYNKCCSYITKYITKQCVKNENNQIYFCSRGLAKPVEYVMIDKDLRQLFGDKVFSNEYCQKFDFDISAINSKERIKLLDYYKENDEYFENENNFITNWLQLFTNYCKFDNIQIHK